MTIRSLVLAFVLAAGLTSLVAMSAAQDGPPSTTEIEQLKLENATLRAQLGDAQDNLGRCQGQLGNLIGTMNKQQAEERIKTTIEKMEAARPGWAYDVRTGQWSQKPKPKP
jgi:TolA-binding protein